MRFKWVNISGPFSNEFPFLQKEQLRRVSVDGLYLCIIRQEDAYYAVKDKCPHAGARLSDGWCKDNVLTCPLHRMQFDLKTGREVNGGGYGVETFPIEQRADGIYVGFPLKWWQSF